MDHLNLQAKRRIASMACVKKLFPHGFKINAKDSKGNSPLHRLLMNRPCKPGAVRLFLDHGAKVNIKNKCGKTPLFIAVRFYCSVSVITLLLEKGALVDEADLKGNTPIQRTVFSFQQFDVLKLLLMYGANANLKSKEGFSILHYAIGGPTEHKLEIMQHLLNQGADVNLTGRYGQSALMLAAYFCDDYLDIYNQDKEADVHVLDSEYYSVLHGHECKLDILHLLLDRGADVNLTDDAGNSALSIAVQNNRKNLKAVKLLLENGAFINLTNKIGKSPLYFAIICNCPVDVITFFLDCGAHVNERDAKGIIPLHRAVSIKKCSVKVIQVLINRGGDVNARDNFGNNSLHYAVTSSNKKKLNIIKLLLDSGADTEAVDMENTSPLKRLMIYSPDRDVVKLFLCYGAQIDVPTNEGRTEVLQQLIESCKKDKYRLDCVKLIIKYAFLQDKFSCDEIIKVCENHIVLSSFANACLLEVAQMQLEKVGNLTVHEFVKHKEPKCYINDILIILARNTYTFYREVILAKVKRLLIVYKLEELCVHTVSFEQHCTVILDCYSAGSIARYLSKDEMINLIAAFYNTGFPKVD